MFPFLQFSILLYIMLLDFNYEEGDFEKKSGFKLGKERGEPLQYRRKNKGAAQWAAASSAVRGVR